MNVLMVEIVGNFKFATPTDWLLLKFRGVSMKNHRSAELNPSEIN